MDRPGAARLGPGSAQVLADAFEAGPTGRPLRQITGQIKFTRICPHTEDVAIELAEEPVVVSGHVLEPGLFRRIADRFLLQLAPCIIMGRGARVSQPGGQQPATLTQPLYGTEPKLPTGLELGRPQHQHAPLAVVGIGVEHQHSTLARVQSQTQITHRGRNI